MPRSSPLLSLAEGFDYPRDPLGGPPSLGALASLGGEHNDFEDPTGEEAAWRRQLSHMNDVLDLQSGLNWTGRAEQATAKREAEDAQLAAQTRIADDQGYPDVEAASKLNWADEGALRKAQMDRRLAPLLADTGDIASEAAAGRHFLPEASALHAQTEQDKLDEAEARYGPAAAARIHDAELKHQDAAAKLSAGAADMARKATSADERNRWQAFSKLIGDQMAANINPTSTPYAAEFQQLASQGGRVIGESDLQDYMKATGATRDQAVAMAKQRAAEKGLRLDPSIH